MTIVQRSLISLLVVLGVAGCTDDSSQSSKTGKDLTPTQLSCLKGLHEKEAANAKAYEQLMMDAMLKKQSTEQLVLNQRRFNEQLCAMERACLSGTALGDSPGYFESCLSAREQSLTVP